MGVNVPASMLPRSTSTPVIYGQYAAVRGVGALPPTIIPLGAYARTNAVGIVPIIPIALGALAITGGLGYLAGRGNNTPTTLGGGIGKGIGDAIKWTAIGAAALFAFTGKNPLKKLFKK